MKKQDDFREDKETVIGIEGPGKVVNFFDPYPDKEDAKVNNSDSVNAQLKE
ncbi:hypothetical protein LS684_23200 (plasmid) [Cytobacillus spongiae]|uniref:hypothetical protein n=1 Tax=Cytobacillus spongiae TaxID=2901381 RepID=UPI00145D8132|nr:hypothetical protein [Cytobacillus spongiae]MCA1062894.1 hypothetical protein [Rossellomorea aquimaris]NMH70227.1 hypothetical protein [Bacillus sp. RO3]UII58499.1 hypothetical protein LS684_23200 [Cytobacillus spongiae]WJV28478.1 hypothetical protein QTG56_15435 [Rossellomorea sp. AcN35-11]